MADTHLGFDYPIHPRVERRRRGKDFFMNFQRILDFSMDRHVDAVIHGGDLFFRAKIPVVIVDKVYNQLRKFTRARIPILLLPGNHEYSRLPAPHRIDLPGIYLFESPTCFQLQVRGIRIAIGGFPFHRKNIRGHFPELVNQTGILKSQGDIRLLVIHQAIEGAQVGKSNYTFRSGDDVVSGKDIPTGIHAVLSGHIHRHQILNFHPRQKPLPVLVIYSGSIERTSFAEREEDKGFYLLEFTKENFRWGLSKTEFHALPVRPMVVLVLDVNRITPENIDDVLKKMIRKTDIHAIVRLTCNRPPEPWVIEKLKTSYIRSVSPVSMNLSLDHTFYPQGKYSVNSKGSSSSKQVRLALD